MLPRILATRLLARTQMPGPTSVVAAAAATRRRSSSSLAVRAAGGLNAEAEASHPPPYRRRRRLFGSPPPPPPQQQQQQREEHGLQQHPPADQPAAEQQQQQQREEQGEPQSPDEQLQQRHDWWLHPAAKETLQVFVYWDLDNLQPQQWSHMTPLVGALKAALQPFGCLRRITAYANTTTLTACEFVADRGELWQEVEAAELRCDICGNRFTSLVKLQKHFKQLHEREHSKQMRAPKRSAQKYVQSEKAQRVRAAGRVYSTPPRNRSGKTGQAVKILLQQQQVACFEVPQKRQAADEAICRHIKQLQQELSSKAADELPELPASRKQQQKQREARHESAAALKAETGPWHGVTGTALERSVLVVVSDDRGFAGAMAQHLASGGAGVVLVTSRSAADWLRVLKQAASDCGSRLGDVALVPWGLLLPEEEEEEEDEGDMSGMEESWGWRGRPGLEVL